MFRVIDNEIEMIRGDSAVFDFTLLDYRGYPVDLSTFEDGDLVFTVKAGAYTNKVSIQKEIVDGQVTLDPGDTEDLSYGKYVYSSGFHPVDCACFCNCCFTCKDF